MYKILFPFLGFNSTLVQLKVSGQRQGYPQSYWFQFYLSSIKRKILLLFRLTTICFNSTLVQLKETNKITIF